MGRVYGAPDPPPLGRPPPHISTMRESQRRICPLHPHSVPCTIVVDERAKVWYAYRGEVENGRGCGGSVQSVARPLYAGNMRTCAGDPGIWEKTAYATQSERMEGA